MREGFPGGRLFGRDVFCYRRVCNSKRLCLCLRIGGSGSGSVFRLEEAQAECIAYDKDGTEAHGESRNHRIHLQTKGGVEASGSNRDTDCIVEKGPEQVFLDVADGRFAQFDGACYIQQVVLHQDNVSGFHGDVSTCADGDSDICSGKGRSIVDSITDHGGFFAAFLNPADFFFLILREHFGDNSVHTDLPADCFGSLFVVSGQHDDFNSHGLKLFDSLTACRFYDIGYSDHAKKPSAFGKV